MDVWLNYSDWCWDFAIVLLIRPWDKETLGLFCCAWLEALAINNGFLPIFKL